MDKLGKRTTMVLQLAVLAMIVALVSVGLWQVHGSDPMLLSFQRPARPGQVITVMDTTCELHAVVPANAPDTADAALKDAQASLEQVERLLSAWKPDSEISRINEAGASQLIPLSPRTVEILALSRELAKQTGGAFDVTHAPVFNLWRRMRRERRIPDPEALNEALDKARQASGWDQFVAHPDATMKLAEGARLDLGGVAKGYGIDVAVEAMKGTGVSGGLVNVGGDIRCFGKNTKGRKWRISIQNPFGKGGKPLGILQIDKGAVCTSGNYERYVIIDGKRYSHIIDPRTGWPVDSAPSVTVVAPTAAAADAWATALSVLAGGPDGPAALNMLKDTGIEAMIVVGTKDKHTIHKTPGFDLMLDKK